jgi:hypothetical protein
LNAVSPLKRSRKLRQCARRPNDRFLKQIRKEPQRRYDTVEQLSNDVRRYLEGLPVIARKDTLFYSARKFVRRNRWVVLAAAVAALSLVIGTVIATCRPGMPSFRRSGRSAVSSKCAKSPRLPC